MPAAAAAATMHHPLLAGGRMGPRMRLLVVLAGVLAAFLAIAGRLVWLAVKGGPEIRLTLAEPLARSWSRPDIVDRHGRLLATDVVTHSLYADPHLILDLDELAEKLAAALPGLDAPELRKSLADRSRRFAWVARGLSPRDAQRVHDLGLPGLAFRPELKRAYPLGPLAGHLLGTVNIDNKGLAGLERALDDAGHVEAVQGPGRMLRAPVRLALDIGAQHALAEELKQALTRYAATAAAGVVMEADSGRIVAAVSLPQVDPARPTDWLETARADRLMSGTYELGSIFKALTVAMALEEGRADLDKLYDVRQPLSAGPYTITDLHPLGRPLSVRDIFLHSSNVGAGMMALEAGSERQRAFLERMGLTEPARIESGPMAAPQLPRHWGRAETITIGYGHGMSVAPLQFAAAFASLVNGGHRVAPTLLMDRPASPKTPVRVISAETSARMREILRLNVTSAAGTGRRAEAEAYRVGGKTGTAEMPGRGGYQAKAVISSFAGAFPMDAPRYVTLVSLFEPQTGEGAVGQITAGLNAAPATARIVERIAPLLGVLPRRVETSRPEGPHEIRPESAPFDAPRPAQ